MDISQDHRCIPQLKKPLGLFGVLKSPSTLFLFFPASILFANSSVRSTLILPFSEKTLMHVPLCNFSRSAARQRLQILSSSREPLVFWLLQERFEVDVVAPLGLESVGVERRAQRW